MTDSRIVLDDDVQYGVQNTTWNTQQGWSQQGQQSIAEQYAGYQQYQKIEDVTSYSRANSMSINEYRLLDDISHVLQTPGMYIDFMDLIGLFYCDLHYLWHLLSIQ